MRVEIAASKASANRSRNARDHVTTQSGVGFRNSFTASLRNQHHTYLHAWRFFRGVYDIGNYKAKVDVRSEAGTMDSESGRVLHVQYKPSVKRKYQLVTFIRIITDTLILTASLFKTEIY